MDQKMYTVKTALTEYFQGTIGETTLRNAIRCGEVPHARIGNKIILRRWALDRWMEKRENESMK